MNSAPQSVRVRPATPADADLFVSLVDALAEYERMPGPDAEARERLVRDGFGPAPRFQVYLAEIDGGPVGFAMTFETYSSHLALPTLYLEDLFVVPEARGRGAGWALFRFLAGEATRRGCGRMEWQVLNWNALAIGFYERLGARRMEEWSMYRLTADQLSTLMDAGETG